MLSRRICCCGTACVITFTVQAATCSPAGYVNGAVVHLWTNSGKGTSLGTCTTSGMGQCTITLSAAGTYYYEISASGFTTLTGTQAFACGSGYTFTLTATVLSCCPGFASCCTDTLAFGAYTLNLTDATGTYASASPRCINWTWCTSKSGASPMYTWNGSACVAGGSLVACWYNVTCVGGALKITRQWVSHSGSPNGYVDSSDVVCSAIGIGAINCSGAIDSATATIAASGQHCDGLTWSGTLTPGAFNVMADPVGGTVAISP